MGPTEERGRGDGTVAGPASPGPNGASSADEPVPGEDPTAQFPANLAGTWRQSLMEPERFFARVDYGGTFLRPLLYFLLVVVAWAGLTLVAQLALPSPLPGVEADATDAALSFFIMPFLALAGLVVASLGVHVVLAVAGAARGLGATARVLCYAVGPVIFAVVPLVGFVATAGWGFVIQVAGLREAHGVRTGVAVLAALLPLLALAGLTLLALFVALRLTEGLPYPWPGVP